MEELRPQPIIRKRQKSFVPDEAKVRWMHKIAIKYSHLRIFIQTDNISLKALLKSAYYVSFLILIFYMD